MGVAGWRFAHTKRNLGGRAAIVAVLEEWPVICSVMVAAGSIIMIGISSTTIGAVSPLAAGQRCAAQPSIMHAAEGWMLPVLDLNSAIGSTGHGNPLAMLRYQALQTHRQA